MQYPRVLTIAGSDSGGGAGIQADIKAISATGSYAASAITAVTVQNTLGVEGVHPVPPETIAAQIRCVLSDIGANAVKIGMLHSAEVVLSVRDALSEAIKEGWLAPAPGTTGQTTGAGTAPAQGTTANAGIAPAPETTAGAETAPAHGTTAGAGTAPALGTTAGAGTAPSPGTTASAAPVPALGTTAGAETAPSPGTTAGAAPVPAGRANIVLDPVMVSTSGHRLIEDSAIEVLSRELIPMARIITPNLPEAEVLAGCSITSAEEFPDIARKLSCGGRVSVLMKAGHLCGGDVTDIFYNAETDSIKRCTHPRLDTPNTHGTGCTLSSALASYLAQGLSPDDAVEAAIAYISAAIESGAAYTIGHGHGPVNHFWNNKI